MAIYCISLGGKLTNTLGINHISSVDSFIRDE